jgi:hypothetical protein
MNVPPDDSRQPSSRTKYPPRVPLDYRLVATPVALIRDAEDYHDTEQNTSSSAPALYNPSATANTNITGVPSRHHLDTEHPALTRENKRSVAEHTALRRNFPDAKRQKQHLLSTPAASPTGTSHANKLRLPTPVMPIPQARTSTHGGSQPLRTDLVTNFHGQLQIVSILHRSTLSMVRLFHHQYLHQWALPSHIGFRNGNPCLSASYFHGQKDTQHQHIYVPSKKQYVLIYFTRARLPISPCILSRHATNTQWSMISSTTFARNETMRSKPYPLCTPEA